MVSAGQIRVKVADVGTKLRELVRLYINPYPPEVIRRISADMIANIGRSSVSEQMSSLFLSAHCNEANGWRAISVDSRLFRRYIKGIISHSRLLVLRAPSEVIRVIFDGKLRLSNNKRAPRGNVVAFFAGLEGTHVYKYRLTGGLEKEILALEALDGFGGFFPKLLDRGELGDWFIIEFLPHNVEAGIALKISCFIEVLAPAYLKQIGTWSESVTVVLEKGGVSQAEMRHWLENEGVPQGEVHRVLAGFMTVGMVYGSCPRKNVLVGEADRTCHLVDFEDAGFGLIVEDFEKLWPENQVAIRKLFRKIGHEGDLEVEKQIILWRGLRAFGFRRNNQFGSLPRGSS